MKVRRRISVSGHLTDVLFALAIFSGAITAVVRPRVVLEWAKHAHPQLDKNDKAALLVARLIGIVGLCMSILFVVIVARSL
jgi:hypothetical protein